MASSAENTRLPDRDARWWRYDDSRRRAAAVWACAQKIWTHEEASHTQMLAAWRMYSDQPLVGSGTQPKLYRRRVGFVGNSPISLNIVKAVVDTYTAMITKDLPEVVFQTKGGSATLQRKAQQLEKFIDGTFYEGDFYELITQLVQDSALFPFGSVQVYEDYSDPKRPKVGFDRTMAWEILVDEQESINCNDGKPPHTLYRVRGMDRLAAMSLWPELAEEIFKNAPGLGHFAASLAVDNPTGLSDMIAVVESWHRSYGGDDPSCHCIVTGNIELHKDEVPSGLELLYRLRPTSGMWKESLALELKGLQSGLNRVLNQADHAMRITSSGHWLVHQNSNINTNAMDNQQGSIWRYTGTPPQFFAGGALPPQILDLAMFYYQKAFESIGVSMSIAQGQVPQLNGSGKAILAYADVSAQRFKPCYRQLQHFVGRIARQVIAVADRISEHHKSFAVKAPGKLMKTVRWADANLEDVEYTIQIKEVNKLADDPVGLMNQIQGLANAGPAWMLPSDGRRLMTASPDLDAWASEMNAARDLVEMLCDRMLESGKYIAPDSYLPLDEQKLGPDNAIRWVHLRLLKAEVDGEDDERMNLLRRWLTEADQTVQDMRTKAAPTAPGLPPGAAMGAPPPGPPSPSPPVALPAGTQAAA